MLSADPKVGQVNHRLNVIDDCWNRGRVRSAQVLAASGVAGPGSHGTSSLRHSVSGGSIQPCRRSSAGVALRSGCPCRFPATGTPQLVSGTLRSVEGGPARPLPRQGGPRCTVLFTRTPTASATGLFPRPNALVSANMLKPLLRFMQRQTEFFRELSTDGWLCIPQCAEPLHACESPHDAALFAALGAHLVHDVHAGFRGAR